MSEETKTPRTQEEITAEYNACCGRAGDLGYRVAVMKQDLDNCHKRMFELNLEAKAAGAKAVA